MSLWSWPACALVPGSWARRPLYCVAMFGSCDTEQALCLRGLRRHPLLRSPWLKHSTHLEERGLPLRK